MTDTVAPLFAVEELHVEVEGREILKGVNLVVSPGEVHAIMGPNGAGKSTLANTLMGHPRYVVTSGRILYKGEDVTQLPPDERARKGMFLAFQYPLEIPGVKVGSFLRMAMKARRGADMPVREFLNTMRDKMAQLEMDRSFADRYVNEGFSGGEKKRNEILQMAMLEPELAVLDETDSGLDVDALRIVSTGINKLRGPNIGMVMITHYHRILNLVAPDVTHILVNGKILLSGGPDLAVRVDAEGYEPFIKAAGAA